MPSERFLRLPEEKRELICQIAMDEFVHVPLEKVSINRIIQKAGISRGCFYTYFEDKRALLIWVLKTTRKQWVEKSIECLEDNHGNIWDSAEYLLRMTLEFCQNNNLVQLHQNLMMYPDFTMGSPDDEKKEQELLYGCVDLTDFREKTKPYFKMVMNQVMLLIIFAVAAFYRKEQTEDEIVKEFKNQLTMLRYGACEVPEKK